MGWSSKDSSGIELTTVLLWNPPDYPRVAYIRKLLRHRHRTFEVCFRDEKTILNKMRKIRQLLLARDLLRLWVIRRPHVMIVFSPVPCSILGVILGRLLGVPIVYDLYYSWVESQIDAGIWSEGGVRTKLGRLVEGFLLRSAEIVLVDTNSSKEYFCRLYQIPNPKIHPIYGVVDSKIFSPEVNGDVIRAEHNLQGKKVVMYHGSFQHVHGVDRIIRLIPAILERVPDVTFLLVGTGPTYQECKDLAGRMGLNRVVVFTGRVEHDSLPKYLACCDIWLGMFTSGEKAQRTARFGMFEAMAAGKPVITAKTREAESILTNGVDGFLVSPENEEEIMNTIWNLASDSKLRRIVGEKARRRIETSFSLKKMEKVLQLCLKRADTSRSFTSSSHMHKFI